MSLRYPYQPVQITGPPEDDRLASHGRHSNLAAIY